MRSLLSNTVASQPTQHTRRTIPEPYLLGESQTTSQCANHELAAQTQQLPVVTTNLEPVFDSPIHHTPPLYIYLTHNRRSETQLFQNILLSHDPLVDTSRVIQSDQSSRWVRTSQLRRLPLLEVPVVTTIRSIVIARYIVASLFKPFKDHNLPMPQPAPSPPRATPLLPPTTSI